MRNFKSDTTSNVFFLVPLVLSYFYSSHLHFALILVVLVISTLHHLYNKKKFNLLDYISAISLITYNTFLMVIKVKDVLEWLIVLLVVVLAFFFWKYKRKDGWEWHLLSAIITSLVIIFVN